MYVYMGVWLVGGTYRGRYMYPDRHTWNKDLDMYV